MPEIVPGNSGTWPLGEVFLYDVGAENYSRLKIIGLPSSQFSPFKSRVQRKKKMVEAEDQYQHHNKSCQISRRRLHRRKMVFLVPPVRSIRINDHRTFLCRKVGVNFSHTPSLSNTILELMTFQKANKSISCFKKLSQTCPRTKERNSL
ncbi:hypothetical protein Hanom_Chr02g00174411 [Helianthus anomalus]